VTPTHEVVDHDAWLAARIALLEKEKQLTRLRDALSRERRALPWEAVDAAYSFAGPDGPETLTDLFAGRSQLIVYHFMFPPEWDEGCPHCSFWADNFDPVVVHLAARDVTLVAVSRAPIAKLEAYRRRMGWGFHWASSHGSDFNYDHGVSFGEAEVAAGRRYNYTAPVTRPTEREGMSVFVRDAAGAVYHTYSAYARGIDLFNTAYNYLDTVPRGRDEEGRPPQYWGRGHDEYTGAGTEAAPAQ
jgi:predicted dithiol-disulfide oxidoreductase (DUF899 family)